MRPFLSLALLLTVSSLGFAQPTVAPTDALTPEQERKSFKLPPGFEAQLVVAEPAIYKPMQMSFDLMGRLWVTSSLEYPWAVMGKNGRDKLVILDDFGEDGKARIAQADDLDGGNGGKRGGKPLVGADRDHSPGIIRPILLRSRSKTEISSSASCAACA